MNFRPFLCRWLVMLACWPLAAHSAPLLVAHRGASHDAPENTLAAFRLAWEQNADAVEGDFYLTKDGEIVCIHDRTTKRTAGVDLDVAQSTLADLRRLDVGSWKDPRWRGERIPTLSEVLQTVPKGKGMLVEVKCGPEIVPPLKSVLGQSELETDQLTIISFNADVISASKRQLTGIKAYWLTGFKQDKTTGGWTPTWDSVLQTLRETGADGLDSQAHDWFLPEMVTRLRREGYEFHVWTVDDPILAHRMRGLGAQSITTNRPEWLRMQLQDARPRDQEAELERSIVPSGPQ